MAGRRRLLPAALAALLAGSALVGAPPASGAAPPGGAGMGWGNPAGRAATHSLRGPETDEQFYFVMADRFANGDPGNDLGGYPDDRLVSGFDPTSKGFYNGGDLRGLIDGLDYVQGLGTTAIWLTPSFANKPVQGPPGQESAGYHGYWITDFTRIDPHLGTNEDLTELIDAAHGRGMKVYFDIITNHTADVITYAETGGGGAYVPKDTEPYRTAAGDPFDDRDVAGTDAFPELDPAVSFPYTPVVPADEPKTPAWLDDPTMYHNRGDTTFVGEDSQYGDFFGLDDLFTERPEVVDGMVDIYRAWVDFGVDGFRIDTMKHVDDAFWQQFAPEVLDHAHAAGKSDFFMFGEVYDTTRPFTSRYTTTDEVQAVLDFPFQDAARTFASRGGAAGDLANFFVDDDWYTDADSNAYQLPTFLGNHDMGRIGSFVQADNPGAGDDVWLAKDRLAHELMAFSRGNPVVYSGDEQGFTGTGGDQLARQTLFASQVPEYLADDLIGTDSTHAVDHFDQQHPLYTSIAGLAALTREHPALRDGAQQQRFASDGPGVVAFSRTGAGEQVEHVVALNNSTEPVTATFPTYGRGCSFSLLYASPGAAAPADVRTDRAGRMTITVPPLSTVVYRADQRVPKSWWAPRVRLAQPEPAPESAGRMAVEATVSGSSFAEVTFQARVAGGKWESIGTDDNAPYRVFHDVSRLDPGTRVQYRAAVLDNAGHTATSGTRRAQVPAPTLTIAAPVDGAGVLADGVVSLEAVADPERADHVVAVERRLPGGDWAPVRIDDSSPVYTATDDLGAVEPALLTGSVVSYRATLTTVGGATATDQVDLSVVDPLTSATVHYFRPGGDYGGWGLHLWGDAVRDDVLPAITWDDPFDATGTSDGWLDFTVPLDSPGDPLSFIVHQPGGDVVPTTREPGGDRWFVPLDSPEIWLVQGDPTVHTSPPPAG